MSDQAEYADGRARAAADWKAGEYVIVRPWWWSDTMWRGYRDGLG